MMKWHKNPRGGMKTSKGNFKFEMVDSAHGTHIDIHGTEYDPNTVGVYSRQINALFPNEAEAKLFAEYISIWLNACE